MHTLDWYTLLTEMSLSLIKLGHDLPIAETARAAGWLGYPPAEPADIAMAEARLGRQLPSSLRAFYLVSNGWGPFGCFIWNLLPVQQIDWLHVRNPGLYATASEIEALAGPWPHDADGSRLAEHQLEQGTRVMRSLVLNSDGDDSTWLLDPGTLSPTGEWSGGRWAHWNPAMEWKSDTFAGLVQDEYTTFLELSKARALAHPADRHGR